MKVTPGISFAIPIDYAKEFLKRSEEARKSSSRWPSRARSSPQGGAQDRRYMGITMLTINAQILNELRQRFQVPTSVRHGIVVFRIIIGSPADAAGLLPGNSCVIRPF